MIKDPSLELLSSIPFFSGLSPDQLNEVRHISTKKHFNKGEIIFSDGEEADGSYLIFEGTVKVFKLSPNGKEHIFYLFSSGRIFGETAAFAGEHFSMNAEAITETRALFFPRSAFLVLIQKSQILTLKMLADLSHKLRILTTQIENLSSKEIPARLAAYLLLEAQEQGLGLSVDLKITKSQLASMLSTIPETLSRVFAKLSTHCLIRVEGRRVVLLDRVGLTDLSETGKIFS